MLEPEVFGKAMAAIVREATAPLLQRISDLEAKVLTIGAKGDQGDAGERGADGPIGATGEPGTPGERGEAGPQGEPGRDAEPAAVARALLATDDIRVMVDLHVAESVAKHFEANPVVNGKDGRDGIDGKDGERGTQGDRGEKGEVGMVGKDGAGVADLLIDREGCLVATMTDGRMKSLGSVVGRDGAPGKDGADFSDATLEYDGERSLTVRGKGGDLVKRMPIPIDRGYWAEGKSAEQGDVFTDGGSVWIALRETKAKPSHENKSDWRLMVRRGRDGIDGRNGRDLGPAPPVKLANSDA